MVEVTGRRRVYGSRRPDGHAEENQGDLGCVCGGKSGYPHFMLKEIHEQPQTILDTIRGRYSTSGEADLPDIGLTRQKQFADTWGASGSWRAAPVGTRAWSANICWRNGSHACPGRYRRRIPVSRSVDRKNDLFITISQSGKPRTPWRPPETKQKGARVVSIVNVVGRHAGSRIGWRVVHALWP